MSTLIPEPLARPSLSIEPETETERESGWKLAPQVRFERVEGANSAHLFLEAEGLFFQLNDTAVCIVEALAATGSTDAASLALCNHFDLSSERAALEVERFVGTLENAKILLAEKPV